MDYEKKYKDALANARQEYNTTENIERKQWLEELFPELGDSEDEMIRKELIRETKGSEERLFEVITNEEFIAWLEKQGKPQDKGEISDGYHTFNELYYYRMLYNAAFFNMLPKEWVHKSKRHNDGEECFGGGWFIVMANLPTGQISNHYELKDWDLFQIPEKEVADKWDGHTPQEAADRLHKYLLEKQCEQKPFDYEHATITQKDFAPKDYHNIDPHFGISVEDLMSKKNSADKVKPIFSIGDVLCDKSCTTLDKNSQPNIEILDIRNGMYICNNCTFPIYQQDEYELVTKKIEPQSAWSDEDEGMKENIEGALDCYESMVSEDWEREKEWLNSIKDRLSKVKKC